MKECGHLPIVLVSRLFGSQMFAKYLISVSNKQQENGQSGINEERNEG